MEDKKAEESADKKAEEKTEDKKEPQIETSPLIEKANEAAERLEKATSEMEKERSKMEKVSSDLTLQGKGIVQTGTPLSKEEQESNARVQRIGEAAGAQWAEKKKE